MSQSNKVNKITIRNRPGAEGKLTVGANTQILFNDQPIGGACFVKFEVHARKVAKVTIEMFAEVEIEANVEELQVVKEKDTGAITSKGKALVRRTLSSYAPVAIDIKKE